MRKTLSMILAIMMLFTLYVSAPSYAAAEEAWVLIDTHYFPIRSEFQIGRAHV